MQHISLKKLEKNRRAIVMRIAGSDDFARRIRAMGIYPGAHIEVMNRPFFNDSLVVKVDGCLLIVRKQEADCVTVEPVMHKKEW